jgi:hypothetical protein
MTKANDSYITGISGPCPFSSERAANQVHIPSTGKEKTKKKKDLHEELARR